MTPERIPYGGDPDQFVDFRVPAQAAGRPLLINIHGGFWRSRYDLVHADPLCDSLTLAGFPTANIEYRRSGQPGGGWPGTFDDVRAAVHLARSHVNAPAVVMGHSAGGHLALWLASEMPGLAGVVALAPVASLRLAWELYLSNGAVCEFLGGAPDEVPDRYAAADPCGLASFVPRTLVHGDSDDVVPLELSRAYLHARSQDPNPPSLLELPGINHSGVLDAAIVQRAVAKLQIPPYAGRE
jgi:acetyl esterase/lipase